MSEEQKKCECRHARLDCHECFWKDGYPAEFWKFGGYGDGRGPAPEKPSADQVTTEHLERMPRYMCDESLGFRRTPLGNVCGVADAIGYAKLDIRANVERETKGLREENARLREELSMWKRTAGDYHETIRKLGTEGSETRAENARLRGEVERLTKEREKAKPIQEGVCMECGSRGAGYGVCLICRRKRDVRDGCTHRQVTDQPEGAAKCDACGAVVPLPPLVEKQERAPEKTGRLPTWQQIVFARRDVDFPWLLAPTETPDGRPAVRLLTNERGTLHTYVELTRENEGVLWCWPTPGMV